MRREGACFSLFHDTLSVYTQLCSPESQYSAKSTVYENEWGKIVETHHKHIFKIMKYKRHLGRGVVHSFDVAVEKRLEIKRRL